MTGGKAHGQNRQYQLECRDVLIFRKPELTPWKGDGVDVPFELPETARTIDVALRAPGDSLVVAECKRWDSAVKQMDIDGFAHRVERLREFLEIPVAGVFIAKSGHQLGTIKVGEYEGIQVAVLDEGSAPPDFNITFLRYDFARATKLRDMTMHVAPGSVCVTGYDAALAHRNAAGEVIGTDRAATAE